MIYCCKIEVPNRAKWGDVFQAEFVLPAEVKEIKSFLANAIPDANSRLKRLMLAGEDEPRDIISTQIGTVSATVNNTVVVADNTPLCVTNELSKGTFNTLRIVLPKPLRVDQGAPLRFLIEEKNASQFVKNADGESEYTNGYTAKLYIEY